MASRSWKVSCVLKQELMQTRMISLLVEWCETEDRRSSTICYDDICLAYARPGCELPVDVVRKGPQNDCYIKVPHPLLDPVLEANMERLQLFYERTFWCISTFSNASKRQSPSPREDTTWIAAS